jgi:hypothetical protein
MWWLMYAHRSVCLIDCLSCMLNSWRPIYETCFWRLFCVMFETSVYLHLFIYLCVLMKTVWDARFRGSNLLHVCMVLCLYVIASLFLCAWFYACMSGNLLFLVYRNLFFLLCESLFLSISVRLISAAKSLWCSKHISPNTHGWFRRLF